MSFPILGIYFPFLSLPFICSALSKFILYSVLCRNLFDLYQWYGLYMKTLLDNILEALQSYRSPFQKSLRIGGLIFMHALMLCFQIATFLYVPPGTQDFRIIDEMEFLSDL
jgi:ABC-type spermidine/putrescine transport system permease subunit I